MIQTVSMIAVLALLALLVVALPLLTWLDAKKRRAARPEQDARR